MAFCQTLTHSKILSLPETTEDWILTNDFDFFVQYWTFIKEKVTLNNANQTCISPQIFLIHFTPLVSFNTPWKTEKQWFSAVSRSYRNISVVSVAWNRLNRELLETTEHFLVIPADLYSLAFKMHTSTLKN